MSKSFWIGTAPFCKPHPDQCEKTPGYKATIQDQCGDGSCCWSGKKIKCEYDESLFSNDLSSDIFNKVSKSQWFGTSPFCGAEPCDVYKTGMLPIKADKCGDGSCCLTGEKWLGIHPQTEEQKINIKQGKAECWDFKKLQEKTLQAGLNFGCNIVETVGKLAPLL